MGKKFGAKPGSTVSPGVSAQVVSIFPRESHFRLEL